MSGNEIYLLHSQRCGAGVYDISCCVTMFNHSRNRIDEGAISAELS